VHGNRRAKECALPATARADVLGGSTIANAAASTVRRASASEAAGAPRDRPRSVVVVVFKGRRRFQIGIG
jgi:hypothetical protein